MRKYIGIDLGGTNIVAAVVDEERRILSKRAVKTMGHRPFEVVIDDIAALVEAVAQDAGMGIDAVEAVGMGAPSYTNPQTGLLVHANNMNWHNVPLLLEMRKRLNVPFYLENDADCAALGEIMAGNAREYDSALMLTLGTGIGGGMIINRRIFKGCDGMGPEFGHTKLIYNGRTCTCGKRGCFEAYGSATALIAQTIAAIKAHPDSIMRELCAEDLSDVCGKTAFDAARMGDAVAFAVIDQYIDYLAAGISSFISIFRPQVIILGGGISEQGDYLLSPLNQKIQRYTFASEEIGVPEVIRATLGNDAGVIGAAMLGFT